MPQQNDPCACSPPDQEQSSEPERNKVDVKRLKLQALHMRKAAQQVKEGAILGRKAVVFMRDSKEKHKGKELVIRSAGGFV